MNKEIIFVADAMIVYGEKILISLGVLNRNA